MSAAARLDLGLMLEDEVLARIDLAHRIKLLRDCGIVVSGAADGWRAEVDRTAIHGVDFAAVVEQALRVLRTRDDLWPTMDLATEAS